MKERIKIYTVSTPDNVLPTPETCAYPSVQLKYRVGADGNLQRANSGVISKNSIMGIFDAGGIPNCNAEELFEQIISEYKKRSFTGILYDFKRKEEAYPLLESLCRITAERSIESFIPVDYAKVSEKSKIIVPAQVSGGSLKEMLSAAAKEYGNERICAAITRESREFPMPAFEYTGRKLKEEEITSLMSEHNASPYFSSDIGSKYFTYRKENEHRFVLYDDTFTASYKISLAKELGLYCAFISLTDWGDSLQEITENIN